MHMMIQFHIFYPFFLFQVNFLMKLFEVIMFLGQFKGVCVCL